MVDSLNSPFSLNPEEFRKNVQEGKDVLVTKGRVDGSEDNIRRITRSLGNGSITSAITEMFYGHNHRGIGNAAPANDEQHGMTFFTRPNLNLSYDNIKFIRTMVPVLAEDPNSIQRALRAYLDPEGSRNGYKSNLVDPYCAFLPLLENNLISLSGLPDVVVDKYTSKEGMYREQFSMMDGFADIYNAYSATLTFRNIVRDPITYFFYLWTQYGLRVHEGTLDPRFYSILENEIDYMTRIYRFTLDPSRRFIQRAGCTGVAFPVSSPIGPAFNIPGEDKYINRDLDQITIEFQCLGFAVYDAIILQEFNMVVEMFNPNMREGRRQQNYVMIPHFFRQIFNYRGYPHINLLTTELEWWIDRTSYESILRKVPGVKEIYFKGINVR